MTDDPRAAQFRDAALRMKERQFPVRVEVGGDDEMASLGRALHDLGRTLERSYREADLLLERRHEPFKGLALIAEADN